MLFKEIGVRTGSHLTQREGWGSDCLTLWIEADKVVCYNHSVSFFSMKKICRIIAGVMLAVAIGFMGFALNHPESVFPWNNTVTCIVYGSYFLVMVILFIAPFKKLKK